MKMIRKRSIDGVLLAGFTLAAFLPPASSAQGVLPANGQVTAGSVTISTNGDTMTIEQTSANAVIDWQSFSIGAGNSVTFHQPGAGSVALNRVLGPDPSTIMGTLKANGQVFLVNPNGVLFSSSARVNVGGLVATTLNIRDDDFMAGNYHFEGDSHAMVDNQGGSPPVTVARWRSSPPG